MYESVAKLCNTWNATQTAANGWPCVGLVAGATDIPALRAVRTAAPDAWILCPGVGAQGGDAPTVCGVGLRKADGSGLLVSVSRGISKAADMAQASVELRDEINNIRAAFMAQSAATSEGELLPFQREFIEFAVGKNVLQFGTFKLKSGRLSPYFFNAGLFCCGQSLVALSRFYAMSIRQSGVEFDVIFGPAYKGIPLATAVGMAWFQLYGESKDICYNRKEAKDHGEGGQLVGASMGGRRVLVVDDVITAGTAIRESVDILRKADAHLAAVAVMLDRQEKATDTSTESAIQQVEKEYGIPVLSIVRLKNLVAYVHQSAATASASASSAEAGSGDLLQQIQDYRTQYGVEY
jgi:orotate phosphoribosyltransferase